MGLVQPVRARTHAIHTWHAHQYYLLDWGSNVKIGFNDHRVKDETYAKMGDAGWDVPIFRRSVISETRTRNGHADIDLGTPFMWYDCESDSKLGLMGASIHVRTRVSLLRLRARLTSRKNHMSNVHVCVLLLGQIMCKYFQMGYDLRWGKCH